MRVERRSELRSCAPRHLDRFRAMASVLVPETTWHAITVAFITCSLLLFAACPQTSGTYTIRTGDSLSVIASTCGTSVQCLQTANPSITDTGNIRAGQTLQVPSLCAAPAPSSASTSRARPYAQHTSVGSQGRAAMPPLS